MGKRQKKQRGKSSPRKSQWLWPALGGGAILTLLIIVFALLLWPRASGLEFQPLPPRGDPELLKEVQSFQEEGREHVSQGEPIDYQTELPTSGPHYDRATTAGFYTEPQPPGNLVHSLEHGAIVIYYHPEGLTPEAERSLRAFAQAHRNPYASVIVVPHPKPNPEFPYILTAWKKMLKLKEYDAEVVRAFLAEYLGRGPENPVR